MRNKIVDIIRGFAMLLVVLGHTLSGSTANFKLFGRCKCHYLLLLVAMLLNTVNL